MNARRTGPGSNLPSLRLHLFGASRLSANGVDTGLALKRGFALLAYLAHARRPIPRGHLASLLWSDVDESVGRARLRRLVYRVESAAGKDLIVAVGDNVDLEPGRLTVDSLEFAELAQDLVASEPSAPSTSTDSVDAWVAVASRPLLQDLDSLPEAFEEWRRERQVDYDQLLARLLRHVAQVQVGTGDAVAALGTVEKLLRLDPHDEASYVLLMQVHAAAGSVSGIEGAYTRCADALRAEFGIPPGPTTDKAYLALLESAKTDFGRSAPHEEAPSLRFAVSARSTVAYATLGRGPRVLVVMPSFRSHIEVAWEEPKLRRAFRTLAGRFKVVMFDRPGSGLSERLGMSGTSESAAADVLAILDHAGIEKACLFATSDSGPTAVRIAAEHPDRVDRLLLYGTMAKGSHAEDYPWAPTREVWEAWLDKMVTGWGGPSGIEDWAPSVAGDPHVRAWWARMVRQSVSPASLRLVVEGLRDTDVRPLLARVKAPTLVIHRRGDRACWYAGGEFLAQHIPRARLVPLDGEDHWWWQGDVDEILRLVLAFAEGEELTRHKAT